MEEFYSSKLSPVKPGQVITIYGRTKFDASRFEIDLSEAVDDNNSTEIPLQISVRFGDGDEIVRNSHTTVEGWGYEERMENVIPGNVANPIKAGDDFKVAIYIDDGHFFVTINDKPYCIYTQRSDCTQIRRLNIKNDVERIYRVDHESTKEEQWPLMTDDIFRVSIPRFFNINDIFVIKGATNGSSEGSFALNILDENLKRSYFHMRSDLDSQKIKINSQNWNHYWINREERVEISSDFPFDVNTPFKIAIILKESDFHLKINGELCGVLNYEEDIENMFKTMNGIEIVSRDGTKVDVKSFEHHSLEGDEVDFESWAAEITN